MAEEKEIKVQRVPFQPVDMLEENAKVGFYTEERAQDDSIMEPLVRLCCEPKDEDPDNPEANEPIVLTPWCSTVTLAGMVQGCMFLYPLIVKVIKEKQANAEKPQE